jgi:hypothetical protein
MFTYNPYQSLERNVQSYLTAARKANPTHYRVPTFTVYTDIQESAAAGPPRNPVATVISAAQFNKCVGDLRRVGIVGTAKGGDEMFLSDAAWAHVVGNGGSK